MAEHDYQTRVWLAALWRGGAWGTLWRKSDKRTYWTTAHNPDPRALGSRDVYVSVHPLRERRGEHERGRIADVAAMNCLFSEFDAKDFGGDLAAVRRHILGLSVQPQVIVASGGGYHCYWFFREPVPVTEGGREYLAGIQRAWVRWAGGDPGARDLARVLRLPGTLNCKYDPPRRVQFARFDLTPEGTELYDPADLCALAEPHWEDAPGAVDAERPAARETQAQPPAQRGLRPAGMSERQAAGLAALVAGQPEGNRNQALYWAAHRVREGGASLAEALAILLPAARQCGLGEAEAQRTIQSAFSPKWATAAPAAPAGSIRAKLRAARHRGAAWTR